MIYNYLKKISQVNKEKILRKIEKVSIPSGETIAYRQAGSGNVNLLLIHGNQSSSAIYHEFMERYEDKAKVFAIDLAGFGESSYNNTHRKIVDWARDVDEFMEAVGIDKAIVVGHSAGGAVGLKLASDFEDRVEHLIPVASVGVKGFRLPKFNQFLRSIPDKYVYSYEEVANHPSILMVEKIIRGKSGLSVRNMWKASLYNINRPERFMLEIYIDEFFKERCFTDISAALCEFNITDEVTNGKGDGSISKISAPVTWIHGKKDLVVPFTVGENSVKYFPNEADFIPIKEAGHMVYNDCPDEFYGHIDEIVDKYLEEEKDAR